MAGMNGYVVHPPVERDPGLPGGYSLREAVAATGLSAQRIRALLRSGYVRPRTESGGALRFSFQDLVLLRTARDLSDRIPARRLGRALVLLRAQIPDGRDPSALRIRADGENIVVQDGPSSWEPLSGQILLNFNVAGCAAQVAPLVDRAASAARRRQRDKQAEEWFERACDLESGDLESARDAYRRALEVDPDHPEAHINLGRILHGDGNTVSAEAHFRAAVRRDPANATALYNLAICAEDQGRHGAAVRLYRRSLEHDPAMSDAALNLALLYERLGRERMALRYFAMHRRLEGRGA